MRIGLFLNNLDEEYQISIYKGIRAEAAALGLDLICVQGETLYNFRPETGGPFPSREYISADGILILTSAITNRTSTSPLPALRQFIHVPLVSIGSRFLDYPSIIVRNRDPMKLLMEHLIEFHSYRKLLYLGGPVKHPDNMVREHVFHRTINIYKEKFPGLEGEAVNGQFHQTSAKMMLREYMDAHPDNPPDAIVSANDNIALGALELLRTQEDLRWRNCPVTGFDDIDQARLGIPALTTIRQPLDTLGKLAVRTLWDILTGKEVSQVIYVESELRIRNSCGCTAPWGKKEMESSGPESDSEITSRSEYHLQNVSLLGHVFITVTSLNEMLAPLSFFLINLAVKNFYLVLYPKPLKHIEKTGKLVYFRTEKNELSRNHDNGTDSGETIEMEDFFSRIITDSPSSWCVYYLRSGREYLGLIVYEAPDSVHPQICSAAVFLANTVRRLQTYEDEKEQAQRLEQEVAVRTKDLTATYQKLQEEIQRRMAVEAEVLKISEMERLRFSTDLHDDICQRLAGISMFCKSLMPGISPRIFLPELSELIDETLARTRRYAHDSFPMELETLGLREALDALCHTVTKHNSCRCVFSWTAPGKSPFDSAQDLNIYRIVQEALQNAVKHSGAGKIDVKIHSARRIFTVTVHDNGTGNPRLNEEKPGNTVVNQEIKRSGLGLRSMRYRAHQLGADYILESSEETGTKVEIRIPLSRPGGRGSP